MQFGKLREELFPGPRPLLPDTNGSTAGIKIMRIAQQMLIWWGPGGRGGREVMIDMSG